VSPARQQRQGGDAQRHQRSVLFAEHGGRAAEEQHPAVAAGGTEQGEEDEGHGQCLGVEVEADRAGDADLQQVGGADHRGPRSAAEPAPGKRPQRHHRDAQRQRLRAEHPQRCGVQPVQGRERIEDRLEVLAEERVGVERRTQAVALRSVPGQLVEEGQVVDGAVVGGEAQPGDGEKERGGQRCSQPWPEQRPRRG
jgi:hypothetical protein